jgi:hypothetical protein
MRHLSALVQTFLLAQCFLALQPALAGAGTPAFELPQDRPLRAGFLLVDLIFGETVARGVGKGLLIEWPTPEERRYPFVSDPLMSRQSDQPEGMQ